MRKAQKAQVLEILKTLREAHKAIKRHISKREIEAACTLLGECQQSAIALGEVIEASEGEACPTVQALEDYCEELYRISEGIPGTISAQKAAKRLHNALAQVESSVRADISIQTEVVFLPYKASMWDSLESVWRAADADPDCNACVIPIPYYDKNPDGSLGQLHYEGGMYPSDVPVIQYDKYDFAKRRPDAVFIHNGYDGCNFVTSVHPDFYSARLRQYTDLLLYIPYFISVNSVSRDLCAVPGCRNADRVFLQSEKIRREYLEVFRKLEPPHTAHATAEAQERKFVALGSPKFDKAITARPEQFRLPEKWARLLTKPDGTRKKIVLYNTSIGSMLQEDERYLKKLRCVLEDVQALHDVVLWWRPHPLIESTFRSMRPGLLPEYLQIVKRFQEGGWGIFDTTADVNRAAAYADYYYGDSGSALQATFQAAGKPVMVQRVVPPSSTWLAPLILDTDGRKLYFSPVGSSAILLLDLSSREISVARPGHATPWRPYCRGIRAGTALYLTPVAAGAVLKLDEESGRFSAIPYELDVDRLLKHSPRYERGWNFSWSFRHGEEVFFVGCCRPIMCLNTRSGEITYAADWPDAFRGGDSSIAVTCCCQIGERLVLTGETPVIVYFDMASKRFTAEEIRQEHGKNGFSAAAYGGGYLWLMAAKGSGAVLRYDLPSKEIAVYDRFPAGVSRCEGMCSSFIYANKHLWLFPKNTNAVLRLCAETGEISAVRLFGQAEKGKAEGLGLPVLANGKIYASRLSYPGITVYDAETAAYDDIPIQVPAQTAKAAVRSGPDYRPETIQDTVLLENGLDTMETLIETGAGDYGRLIADWIASPDGRAGERIYRYVKDMMVSGRA